MKIRPLAMASLFALSAFSTARATSFDDVQLWAGSGTNQTALVINWTDGTSSESLLWGYRWDGTATGEQMLYAVMGADSRLYAEVSGSTEFGTALFGIGYDLNNDNSFTLSPDLSFNSQHLANADYGTVDDSRAPTDGDDLWQEGWLSAGYWSYYISTSDRLSVDFSDWDYSGLGMSSRELEDGDWDGWSFAPGFNSNTPVEPTAVVPTPEPTTWAMLLLGGGLLFCFQENRRVRKTAAAAGISVLALLATNRVNAISMDDIQLWTGSGTNHAALVIEWSVPESLTNSSVPVPIADKTLVWGYRFNGTNVHGSDMLNAILAADPKLYVAEEFGDFIVAAGYNLNGDGNIGITDGTTTNFFTDGLLANPMVDVDSARAINFGDLFWNGLYGPNWETWRELGESGGFENSPNRGTSAYWTADDPTAPYSGIHGQWQLSLGIDDAPLADGSWIGLSVAAGEFEPDANAPYNLHKHAPVSPDGTYAAYVCDTNDFAVQIVNSNNIYSRNTFGQYFYTNVLAVLGRPTLKFINGSSFYGDGTIHRVKIVEPAFWTDPSSNSVITEINAGGQITVNMGRKIYHNPNNPYGIDFNVFGNSFYVATGGQGSGGLISDSTDEGFVTFSGSSGTYGHPTTVSVSQDGTNWFTYPYVSALVPDNAYRWDDINHCWTDEQMNAAKPLNPSLNFPAGTPVANALDQFVGAYGGTGYSLQASGFSWVQYIRIWAGTSTNDTGSGNYTVIDAIGAVNPVVVGDALSVTPDNLASGITNLAFQKPSDLSQTLISLNFEFISTNAKISTVSLHEFSSFAPIVGNVSSAYQLQARSLTDTNAVTLQADIGLRVGDDYSGNGSDLRVYQWCGTNWISQPFTFNPSNDEIVVADATNFSAFAVSQIVPPQLNIQSGTGGFDFQFTPVANCENILERSTDLAHWTPIATNSSAVSQLITLHDTNAPADKAFYRVRLNIP